MSTGAEWCRFTLRERPDGADPYRLMASSSVLFVGRSVGRWMFRFGYEENLDPARLFAIVVEWTRDVDAEYRLPCPRLYWLPFRQLSGQPSPAENCWLSSGTRVRRGRAAERPRPSRCRVIQGKCRGPARTRWPMVTGISSPETAERVNVQAPRDLLVRGAVVGRSQRRHAGASMCAAGHGVVHLRTAGVLRSIPGHEKHLTLGTAQRIDFSRHYVTQSATATASALPRLLIVRPACAFGAAPSSVARGARLAAASCFHTLVSPIRRAAGLRHATVPAANGMACRNQVGGRGPRWSGRCARC